MAQDRTRTKVPRIGTEERDKLAAGAADMYRGGYPIRDICTISGYSYGLVRRLLIEAGVTFRPRGGNHKEK
jgi:transposase-like protein